MSLEFKNDPTTGEAAETCLTVIKLPGRKSIGTIRRARNSLLIYHTAKFSIPITADELRELADKLDLLNKTYFPDAMLMSLRHSLGNRGRPDLSERIYNMSAKDVNTQEALRQEVQLFVLGLPESERTLIAYELSGLPPPTTK